MFGSVGRILDQRAGDLTERGDQWTGEASRSKIALASAGTLK